MQNSINRLARLLKPGGVLLLRDYGRYDMAQLRFKKGRCYILVKSLFFLLDNFSKKIFQIAVACFSSRSKQHAASRPNCEGRRTSKML